MAESTLEQIKSFIMAEMASFREELSEQDMKLIADQSARKIEHLMAAKIERLEAERAEMLEALRDVVDTFTGYQGMEMTRARAILARATADR